MAAKLQKKAWCRMSVPLVNFFPYELRRINNREYAGPCPFCAGGDDRFRLWVGREPRAQAYWCRQCKASGDSISLVQALKGCSYPEACSLLGVSLAGRGASSSKGRLPASRPSSSAIHKEPTLPPAAWCTAAAAWVDECKNHLWSSREAWRAYADRYLVVDVALSAGLGWNPQTKFVSRSAWGLPVEQGGSDKLMLPRGIVMPVRRSCGVVGITVRCFDSDVRFRDIAGGAVVPFALGSKGQPVLICESVLDAVLVRQESQGRVAVCATFGASKTFDMPCLDFIRQAPVVFLCPDSDKGGLEGYRIWRKLFPSAHLVLPPEVPGIKDLGDMQQRAFELADNSVPTVASWLHKHIFPHICPQSED